MPAVLLLAWATLLGAAAWRWRPPARLHVELSARDRGGGSRALASRRVAIAVGAVVAGVATLLSPLVGVAVGVALLAWPRVRAHRAHQRRADQAVRALPELTDLLVLATGAGLTPLLALRRLQPFAPPPFADALAEVLGRVDRGERLGDALDRLPALAGDATRPVVAALTATERYGTPLAPALDLLAHEARQQRRRHAEQAARRLPVRMAFPLVGCILPAFVLLTIAPLVAGAVASLRI